MQLGGKRSVVWSGITQGSVSFSIALLCITAPTAAQSVDAVHPVVSDPQQVAEASPPAEALVAIESDGARMNGLLYLADGPGPHPTVLLLHGFPGMGGNVDLAMAFRRAGFNALFLNYRGAWGSEGTFSLVGHIEDAKAAIAFLQTPKTVEQHRVDPRRLTVVGHSLGGFNALVNGIEESALTCTVAVAPALMRPLAAGLANVPDQPVGGIAGYTLGDLREESMHAPPRFDVAARMEGLKGRPLLIVSGSQDRNFAVQGVDEYVQAARHAGVDPFDHVTLDADHNFSWSRIELARVIVNWLADHCT